MSLNSIVGLVLSVLNFSQDRSCLKAKSKFYPAYDKMRPRICVEAVNIGRRPLILKALGGKYEDGHLVNVVLYKNGQETRLGENETYSIEIEHHLLTFGEHCSPLKDLWLEDTKGRHYSIKGVKHHLEMLSNSI